MQHVTFDKVKGYATYDAAVKRGRELGAERIDVNARWVVIALPSGRFAPMVVVNNSVPGGPGMFIGERNVCIIN